MVNEEINYCHRVGYCEACLIEKALYEFERQNYHLLNGADEVELKFALAHIQRTVKRLEQFKFESEDEG